VVVVVVGDIFRDNFVLDLFELFLVLT